MAPGDVPVVELPSTPCSAAELVALRSGRYVPLFGLGTGADEVRRALALAQRALSPNADPRAMDHATTMLVHPSLGAEPLRLLALSAAEGRSPHWAPALVLGLAGMLGANDALRAEMARALSGMTSLATEVALASHAGGGDRGDWRDHYQHLRAADAIEPPVRAVSVARHWYDLVLARRWSGLDGLRALSDDPSLDAASQWLAASGEWLAGEERARARMTDLAQTVLGPLQRPFPRFAQVVAREKVELLGRPWAMRWDHLRCAGARDHASAAIRAWLHAAAEERFFEEPDAGGAGEYRELGPEPSRAGRAAAEARQLAGDFLLDWFVPEREARAAVDEWARKALRVYHRLRGAALAEVALRGARGDGVRLDDVFRSAGP